MNVQGLNLVVRIAAQNLLQARRRSLFLSLALGLVTMLLVLLMALSQGISENIIRSATTLTTGHVNVAGFYKATPYDSAPLVTKVKRIRDVVKKAAPQMDYMVERGRGWTRVVSATGALQSMVVGVDPAREKALFEVVEMAPERLYKEEGGGGAIKARPDPLGKPNTVMLFATQAKKLQVEVGDKVTLRSQDFTGQANTVDLTVSAVAKDIGLLSNFSVFVPNAVIQDLYQLKPDTTGALQIYLKDIDDSKETMAAVREALEKDGFELMEYQPAPFFAKFETVSGEDWMGQKLDLTTWEDEVEFMNWILTALDTVSFGLLSILAMIIAIGITNTMAIAVRKRTTEIGTLRAIGMTRAKVAAMFLSEAFLLGLFATTMGVLVAVVVIVTLNALTIQIPVDAVRAILLSNTLHLALNPWHLIAAIASLTLLAVLASLWPALRAAALQPVDAIHTAE